VTVKADGRSYRTDQAGVVRVDIRFDESNYASAIELTAWDNGTIVTKREIDFFTASLIDIIY
jgi:hypothetical protein